MEIAFVCVLTIFVNLFVDGIEGSNLLLANLDSTLQDALNNFNQNLLPKLVFHLQYIYYNFHKLRTLNIHIIISHFQSSTPFLLLIFFILYIPVLSNICTHPFLPLFRPPSTVSNLILHFCVVVWLSSGFHFFPPAFNIIFEYYFNYFFIFNICEFNGFWTRTKWHPSSALSQGISSLNCRFI